MSSKKSVNIKDLIMGLGPLLALVLLCIVLSFATDKFLHYSNFMNILKQAAINCLIASGMLVVLITAGIDLSVGSNCVLSACIMGVMMLAAAKGSFVTLEANGADEQAALDALTALIANYFGEGE